LRSSTKGYGGKTH